jgi:hypothetical protein
MASGGFKPLGPSKIVMDTSKAMAILGFNSSQGFENTEMAEVQSAFMKKLQRFEHMAKGSGNPRNITSKRDELRRVNEAYQYLIRKRRKLTGRAMTDNWQLVGSKSNKAMDIITSLKGFTGNKSGPSITAIPLMGNQSSKKKFDNEMKKQVAISPYIYEHILYKVFCEASMCLQIGLVIFWQKKRGAKAACKMLVNLTKGGERECCCQSSCCRTGSKCWT